MEPEEPSDELLMQRFRESSDEAAFDALLVRYRRPAMSVAWSQLGRGGMAAEDAVQEAFVSVFRHRGRFDCSRSFAAWFYTILRNVCTDFRRKQNRREVLADQLANDPSIQLNGPASAPGSADELLLGLQPADREILVYRVVHGMTFPEIAAQLGCPVETAKKRAQRALRRLREHVSSLPGELLAGCPQSTQANVSDKDGIKQP